MKYIKLFEDLNEDGYEEVILNRSQFSILKAEGITINNSLSKNIANELTKDMKSLSTDTDSKSIVVIEGITNVDSYTVFVYHRFLFNITQITEHSLFIRTNNDGVAIGCMSIYHLKDDWYYVDYYDYKSHTYYKCDQFYGLINCLNEIFKPLFLRQLSIHNPLRKV